MRDLAVESVEPTPQRRIVAQRLSPFIRQLNRVGERDVRQGKGGRIRHDGGHVGDAVVYDSLFAVDRIMVGGSSRSPRSPPHHLPIYREEGVVHYCVTNMPAVVP